MWLVEPGDRGGEARRIGETAQRQHREPAGFSSHQQRIDPERQTRAIERRPVEKRLVAESGDIREKGRESLSAERCVGDRRLEIGFQSHGIR